MIPFNSSSIESLICHAGHHPDPQSAITAFSSKHPPIPTLAILACSHPTEGTNCPRPTLISFGKSPVSTCARLKEHGGTQSGLASDTPPGSLAQTSGAGLRNNLSLKG